MHHVPDNNMRNYAKNNAGVHALKHKARSYTQNHIVQPASGAEIRLDLCQSLPEQFTGTLNCVLLDSAMLPPHAVLQKRQTEHLCLHPVILFFRK